MNLQELLQVAVTASLDAGMEILKVYLTNFSVEQKEDNSPLTLADKQSNEAIMAHLKDTDYPVLSEEGRDVKYEERKQWDVFWCVDPLDGTKEFVKRNGEFTVNIALIKGQKPILGVIYVPVTKELYFAAEGIGAFKLYDFVENDDIDEILMRAKLIPLDSEEDEEGNQIPQKFTMVGSRSHMSEETLAFIEELKRKEGEVEIISKGSSLKLCMVAEGKANVYPRFAPTMEWDTAAGHAICSVAGFKVTQYPTSEELNTIKKIY